jgi:hypothetical protein
VINRKHTLWHIEGAGPRATDLKAMAQMNFQTFYDVVKTDANSATNVEDEICLGLRRASERY